MSPPAHDYVTVVRSEADVAIHAQVIAATPKSILCNYEYSSPLEIIQFDAEFHDAGIPLRRWIVGDHANPEGVAVCFRPTWRISSYTFWVQVRLMPGASPSAERALWESIQRWARSAGARALQTMAHPGDQTPLPTMLACTRIGTEQIYVKYAPLCPVELPPRPSGITFHTLAELLDRDSDAIERACTLHAAISHEVPLPDEPVVTLAKFRRLIGEYVDPQHYVVGVIDGQYVAESILHVEDDGVTVWQHATGVVPAYRGLGIGQHVKYAALEIAARIPAREVRTWVESHNASMLHINTRFGFQPRVDESAISHIYEISIVNNGGDGNR